MQERENYFILLGLKPSVIDNVIIEEKINDIEKKWKDRANKTGKTEHKKFVDIIPDIRDVMLNPEKRRAEAKDALIAEVLDSAKLENLKKSLPENYIKIEEALTHYKYTDIYDFLSRDPESDTAQGVSIFQIQLNHYWNILKI